ncbi:MAG TPA: DNA-processing protein DprA [bacterium]|nr:DNA-processing protein DprA [bacterium]
MPKFFSELGSIVLLNRLSMGGGRDVLSLLLEKVPAFEIVERIRLENFQGKQGALEELLHHFSPEEEIENCAKKEIRLMALHDPDYPVFLKHIPDPPVLLYIKGAILETDQAAVAIVGSRLPSFYGLAQAKRFASELAGKGITIVSGLARGIDQAAHEGALFIPYGRTLAVLGCGLDVDYPPRRDGMSGKITERGAVISEYALGTPPRADNFPRRNRIISGLSLGVLVVEARQRSGSLITAHEALEQGREVFAIPGPVDQPTSRGAHQLLKEGAMLTENPEDILESLAGVLWPFVSLSATSQKSASGEREETELTSREGDLLGLLKEGAMASDQITGRLGWGSSAVLPILTKLELEKKIHKKPNGVFSVA